MIVILEAILSTVADAPESRGEYRETLPFSSFHCFARLPSRAWHEIGANGRAREFRSFAAVLIFSLSSRCSSRKATLACTSLSHGYFTAYRNLYHFSRSNAVDLPKLLLLIQINRVCARNTVGAIASLVLDNGAFSLSLFLFSVNWKLKTISFTYESALIVTESTVLYKFGLTLHLLLGSRDVIKVTRPRSCSVVFSVTFNTICKCYLIPRKYINSTFRF